MTLRHFALHLTLLAAAVGPALALGGQPPVEQGFTSLFNGKDLTGWVYGKRPTAREQVRQGLPGRERRPLLHAKRTAATSTPRRSTATSPFRFEFKLTKTPTTASASAPPSKATPPTSAWRSRSSTTTARSTRQPPPSQYHGSIYDVVPASAALKARRRVERPGDHRQGPPDHREAERHDDRRRQPRRHQGRGDPQEAPRPQGPRRATSASSATARAWSSGTSASRN